MTLHLSTHMSGDAAIVDCTGNIAYCEEAAFLQSYVRSLLEQHHQIVLDLSGVGWIDSHGIGTMVGLWASARKSGGDLRLAALGTQVKNAFTITRLTSLFNTFETVDQAAASFAAEKKAA